MALRDDLKLHRIGVVKYLHVKLRPIITHQAHDGSLSSTRHKINSVNADGELVNYRCGRGVVQKSRREGEHPFFERLLCRQLQKMKAVKPIGLVGGHSCDRTLPAFIAIFQSPFLPMEGLTKRYYTIITYLYKKVNRVERFNGWIEGLFSQQFDHVYYMPQRRVVVFLQTDHSWHRQLQKR